MKERIFLAHCAVSPLSGPACDRLVETARAQRDLGLYAMEDYGPILEDVHRAAGELLKTDGADIAFLKNTSEGLGLIANGYPFEPGDEIISYVHEYPANHYPWRLQEKRGVRLKLLPNRDPEGRRTEGPPYAWSMEDLEEAVGPKTRVVALSHVQFTSGYAADLEKLGAFCRERGIDLVVDAAQSLGVLPVYPEQWGVAAVAASGWKWLLGPVGTGLLYTSEEFRDKLGHVMTGAELMRQGMDYLDHRWNPHSAAKRFEYSTSPIILASALSAAIEEINRRGIEAVCREVRVLQNVFVNTLKATRTPPLIDDGRCSSILSIFLENAEHVARDLARKGIVVSARGGYLRIAPHFENTVAELETAATVLARFL